MALALPIYLDNHATTRCDPRVVEAMLPYFSEHYGNAASKSHSFGWTAEAAVDFAREQIATLIGARAKEIVLTSGATEANNLAIKGAAWAQRGRGDHIVTVATEHKAVLDPCKRLAAEGFRVTFLQPDRDGLVTAAQVAEAVEAGTVLVSVMHVNNEIGVIQPIAEIARAIKEKNPGALFHCDAVQGLGKLPFDVESLHVDLVSMTAHKMYGPKGVGALWIRRKPRVRLDALIDGGGHERGLRSGTLAVPLIVGFGAACEIAQTEMASEAERVRALRDRLYQGLTAGLDDVHVNGSLAQRVPGNLNVSFGGVDGESLLMALKDVAISSGSACTSASLEPSYVLRCLGVDDELAHSSIRFGVGRFNTQEEIDYTIELVVASVRRLRELSSATPSMRVSEETTTL
jgi:cysteine desulfurase